MKIFCTGNPARKTIAYAGDTIKWIIEQPFRIPLIQIESVK